jgi:prepilin-type processing-associated H-X9-DG protein
LKELLVLIVVGGALLALLLLFLDDARRRSRFICCNCNLKQIGLAFKTWAIDHTNSFPMAVSTNYGGSLESIATGETFRHYEVMSNELSTPFILVCPNDDRKPLKTFELALANSNVSYFVGVDARDEAPDMFLAGDRNITGGRRLRNGMLEIGTNDFIGWGRGMHNGFGNVALADGSVQQLRSGGLQESLKRTGVSTNRLEMP